MKKTERMMEKLQDRLAEIYNEEGFLSGILSVLKNDYECEHLLRLIEKYKIQTPDNVLIFAVIISEAGTKTKRKGDYLKGIDNEIENAMLEEDESPTDEEEADTDDTCQKSFCELYSLGEMYRQGLGVKQDASKAWEYYQEIVDNDGPECKLDDYYWRACYRLGMELYADSDSEAVLNAAFRRVTEAKELYDARGYNASAEDITKEELYQNWQALEHKVAACKKMRNEMPVIMKVRCIVDDELSLTKGKICRGGWLIRYRG